MSDLFIDNATSLTLRTYINDYLSTGHSFIYILNVRDVALSKNRSLIYIRPKSQRRRIIKTRVTHLDNATSLTLRTYINE
jgi:hypothetical protein